MPMTMNINYFNYDVIVQGSQIPTVTNTSVWLWAYSATSATMTFVDSTRAANNRMFDINWGAGNFAVRVANDAYSAATSVMQFSGGYAAGVPNVSFPVSRLSIGSSSDDGINQLQAQGNIAVKAIGSGMRVAEGSNAKQGAVTLSAGSAVVSNTSVTVNSRIFLTGQSDGGTPGFVRVSSRVAGTSFTITSSSSTDTSTVAYEILEPG